MLLNLISSFLILFTLYRKKKITATLYQSYGYSFGGVDDVKDELYISLRETFFEVFL